MIRQGKKVIVFLDFGEPLPLILEGKLTDHYDGSEDVIELVQKGHDEPTNIPAHRVLYIEPARKVKKET
jgi:hypothetical protein